jgi:hypothetical protein
MYREAASTLAYRNGGQPNTLRIYNTYTDASNYERLRLGFATNIAYLSTESLGTGTQRGLVINAATQDFQIAGSTKWSIDSSGNLTATGSNDITTSGDFTAGNHRIFSFTRTVPTTVGVEVDIGTFSLLTVGTTNIDMWINVQSSSFSVAKRYNIPVTYGATSGAWQTVVPINNSGPYLGNDFDLEIQVNSGSALLRMRRSAGTTAGTAYIVMSVAGVSSDAFSPSTTTSAVAAPTVKYAPALVNIDTVTNPDINGGTVDSLTTLSIRNQGTGAFDLSFVHNGTMTAGRSLTLNVNDASRSISLSGDLTLASALTTVGAFTLSLTTTGTTNVTLPTTGTLATLAGTETFTNKTIGDTLTLGAAGSATSPQILLNGSSMNWIQFTIAGVGAPAFTTRSSGTKLVLWPQVDATNVDYAIGIENSNIWFSVPTSASQYGFKWYTGTTNAATLNSVGLTVTGTIAASNLSLGGNFATSGASALTLTTTGATNVTLPTAGTLATLAGTETLTNKTLTTPQINAATVGVAATVTAGTNAQGQGALTSDINVVTTASNNPSGVTLPTATVGRWVSIVNSGANPLKVYPASGAAIDGLGANVAVDLPVGAKLEFLASTTTKWHSSATGAKGAGVLTLAGNLTTSGAFATTLTMTGATSVTLPTAGTLATLAGTETLSNKTISGGTFSGTIAGTPTISGNWTMDGAFPGMYLNENDQGTDLKKWFMVVDGQQFQFQTRTDANAVIATPFAVNRSGNLTVLGTVTSNGGKVLTLAGNLTTSGAFATTLTATGTTTVTLPTTGTLATLAGTETFTSKTLTSPTVNGGALTALTALGIRSTGTGAFDLTLANTENLTAGRTLTLKVNDAARTVDLAGNLTLASSFTTSGANALTLTTTGSTNVTLPTSGTLATLAGTETLTNKTLSAPVVSYASVTPGTNTQGQGAMTADINVVSTVGSNPSGVTLPTATTGRRITVINRSGGNIAVFPASGGTIDTLTINASVVMPVNSILEFFATSSTQWYSTSVRVLSGSTNVYGLGYAPTGTGSTLQQSSPRTTSVTINTLSGYFLMASVAQADADAGAVIFTVNNSAVASQDVVIANACSSSYDWVVQVVKVGSGFFRLRVVNVNGSSVTEGTPISFAVFKNT